jgi:hypothetical protein
LARPPALAGATWDMCFLRRVRCGAAKPAAGVPVTRPGPAPPDIPWPGPVAASRAQAVKKPDGPMGWPVMTRGRYCS